MTTILATSRETSAEFKGIYGPNERLVLEPGRIRKQRNRAQYKFLSADEQRQLLKTIKEVRGSDTTIGRQAERDYVIIETFLNLALRRAELAGLSVGDVRNQARLWVKPEIAKMGSCGHVPINRHIQRVLKTFIGHKLNTRRESISDDAPLFVSRRGVRLSLRSINELVEFWMIRAGLCVEVDGRQMALYTVHSLRHACLKRLKERGASLTEIQKFARHKSIQSTAIYQGPTDEEMADVAELAAI